MPLLLIVIAVLAGYKIYEVLYFHGEKFKATKNRIDSYVRDCNELNEHIEQLKSTGRSVNVAYRGHAERQDNSKWNYKRSMFSKDTNAPNVHNCSRNVVSGAQRDPLKYVCKYFGFNADEQTLERFENMLNNFTAVENGRESLLNERMGILGGISNDIPKPIRWFNKKKLMKRLGFEDVDLKDSYYPQYKFQYISSGGNASTETTVVMDIPNLNGMVEYLNGRIKWKKSMSGQRALMTSALRKRILERDGYKCRQCGVSISQEPHLLLEVDHIIPISKGGITTEENLQTLCWRCNRSKGTKVDTMSMS